eukprot:scaffold115_cov241-Pinguiococcus_pyrenoidosus.AAC.16
MAFTPPVPGPSSVSLDDHWMFRRLAHPWLRARLPLGTEDSEVSVRSPSRGETGLSGSGISTSDRLDTPVP